MKNMRYPVIKRAFLLSLFLTFSTALSGCGKDDDNNLAGKTEEMVQELADSGQDAAARADSADDTDVEEEAKELTAKEALLQYAQQLEYIGGLTGYYDSDFVYDEYGNQSPERNYSSIPFGNVDCFIEDFDGDGKEELLIASLYGPSDLELSMYEYDGEVKLSATYDMEGGVDLGWDSADWLFMAYDHDGTRYICELLDGDSYLFGDGVHIYMFSCYYDGSTFVKKGSTGYACSDWYEEDEGVLEELRNCGINADWNKCFEDGICSEALAVTNGERLFEIRETTTDAVSEGDYGMPYKELKGYVRFTGYSPYDFTKNESSDIEDEYIIPDSSNRLLNEDDISGMSSDMLRKARNEIVARHGRRFKDAELQAYFDSKPWYSGTVEADDFDMVKELSDIERANMDFIKEHEQ